MSPPDATSPRLARRLFITMGVVLVAAGITVWNADRRPSPQGDRPPPEAFVAAYALEVPAGTAFFEVALTPDVYRDLSSRSAQDVAVVDAEGRTLPIRLRTPMPPPASTTEALPLPPAHPVPASDDPAAAHAWRIALIDPSAPTPRIEIGASARGTPPVWVVDARSTTDAGIDGIRLAVPPGKDLAIRLRVEASDDLLDWRPLADDRPLLRLGDGATAIEQREIGWPRQRAAWLRLTLVGGRWPDALGPPSIDALRHDVAPEVLPEWTESPARTVEPGRRYAFEGPGALPVEAVAVRLGPPGGAVGFHLRATDPTPGRGVAAGTAWRIEVDGAAIEGPAVATGVPPEGPLELVLDGSSDAPRLVWSYRPAVIQALASGRPPYRLLAGHAGPHRPVADLDAPLAAFRARTGNAALPAASLGPRTETGGPAARAPSRNGPLVLWGLLGVAAFSLGLMAWQQLRRPSTG